MLTLFVIGIVVALAIDERTGYSPGGVITPAYFALALHHPLGVVLTLAAALGALGIGHALERYVLLYGRRRFAVHVLAGLALKVMVERVAPGLLWSPLLGLELVGYVVPGVLAESMRRQSVGPTLKALVLAVVLTRLLGLAVLGW